MSKTSDYIEQYSGEAMLQMERYGIPASVTLAQGILESANGKSQLSRECNNHFGMKASKSWLQNGGQYQLFDDDKPNEKFCKYASVGDSYEHHSKVLASSDRYKACFKLSPDDYKGWTAGLQKGGYATNKQYAASLNAIIQQYHLDQYDQQVMTEMKKEGKSFGVEYNPLPAKSSVQDSRSANVSTQERIGTTGFVLPNHAEYSMPLKREEYLFITSKYGKRTDPMDHSKTQFHQGIDIKTKSDDVLATEDKGKVVKASDNVNTGGGKTVVVEYDRGDGTKTQCVYMHLSSISVKVGDTVNAGQKLGVSGNTGTRTTGEHLHFGVRNVNAEGKQEYVNPAAYLAEINARGNHQIQALCNGKDLLAGYTTSNGKQQESSDLTPEDWTKKLLSSEDSGLGLSGMGLDGNGGMLEMAFTLFSTLLALATQIDGKTAEETMQIVTEATINKTIDLKSLTPSLNSCSLHLLDNGKMILQTDTGTGRMNHELTATEQNSLSSILNSNSDDATKQQKIGNFINGVVVSQQASQNYDEIVKQQQSQTQSLQR